MVKSSCPGKLGRKVRAMVKLLPGRMDRKVRVMVKFLSRQPRPADRVNQEGMGHLKKSINTTQNGLPKSEFSQLSNEKHLKM